MKAIKLAALAALASVSISSQASAATFTMKFSGATFGNNATATGTFDITDAALASINANPMSNPLYSTVSNLILTVTGATSGNGVFTTTNFGSTFQFQSPSPLDFSRELVGQTLSNGRTFGTLGLNGASGDFNLFGNSGGAPRGTIYFTLTTNNGSGDRMALTSLTTAAVAAVPEPATWAMMIVGLGMVGFATRRRTVAVTRVRYA